MSPKGSKRSYEFMIPSNQPKGDWRLEELCCRAQLDYLDDSFQEKNSVSILFGFSVPSTLLGVYQSPNKKERMSQKFMGY